MSLKQGQDGSQCLNTGTLNNTCVSYFQPDAPRAPVCNHTLVKGLFKVQGFGCSRQLFSTLQTLVCPNVEISLNRKIPFVH